ncbi:MAG TPA: histone deacetylase family protein [Rhizomicrobium sp.]|nr:histone deacetylase family protein [Rhizomicrobium sp.]
MATALISHPECFRHEPPDSHPERPARLRAVLSELEHPRFSSLVRVNAEKADLDVLLRVHAPGLVETILESRDAASRGRIQIDADTYMSAGSADAALHAAGAVVEAVDGVMGGKYGNAFCAVRPPGHHAERLRPMGFCLFNNIAVGAMQARDKYGLQRIAVVDFDVHHGNGTQDAFFRDANLFYASTHQMPLYPGTGYENERGVSNNVLNRRLPPGSGSVEIRAVYSDSILPALEAFAPQFIFISAGFDAHRADPLANLDLAEDDFAWITAEICAIAARVCEGRVVSALEGGYDLDALARSAGAQVGALMEA